MMLKWDKENADADEIQVFLRRNTIIRLAFNTGAAPYIVPLSYGFEYENRELTFGNLRKLRYMPLIFFMKSNTLSGFSVKNR